MTHAELMAFRLKFLYKFWRWWQLGFIIYSIFLVEFSLNFNHVQGVLGGPNDNELHLPAQLLPLLIGACSFMRILWLSYSEMRQPGDEDASVVQDHEEVRRSRTIR